MAVIFSRATEEEQGKPHNKNANLGPPPTSSKSLCKLKSESPPSKPKALSVNPKPQNLNVSDAIRRTDKSVQPKKTLNPKPSTLNPRPQTLNPQPREAPRT